MPLKPEGASDLSRRVVAELENARHRARMTGHGWTWTEIEEATGIAHTTMSRMLRGHTDMPVHRLLLICEAIGVPATQIIEDATSHMPDNYLHDLLVSPGPSEVAGNVTRMVSASWDDYEGKKAADVDDEDDEDAQT